MELGISEKLYSLSMGCILMSTLEDGGCLLILWKAFGLETLTPAFPNGMVSFLDF
jgi:hypothetical protein